MQRRNKVLLGAAGVLAAGVTVFALMLSHDAPCPDPDPAAGAVSADGSMRALRAHCYGGVEALRVERVPIPVPADDELLVRVHAAGLNPLDWHVLHGKPYVMRLSSGFGRPADARVGVDFSGTVESVGSAVRGFKAGDAVFGARRGAFAEYMVVREGGAVAHLPDSVDFEQAAGVPIAATTALQAVRDAGQVTSGMHVLINGASGGVGSFAVQIAKAMGAEVTGVSSARNTEWVRSLGADHAIDYAVEDFTTGGPRFDVVIDNVGNHGLSAMRAALKPDGILVMVTGPKTNNWLGPIGRMLGATLSGYVVSQTQVTVFAETSKADMTVLRDMLAAGHLRAIIDRRFAMDTIPEAITYLEQGRTRGKNIIVMPTAAH